jgi:uncharacterized membrane protein YraQ (UPF0718 family)
MQKAMGKDGVRSMALGTFFGFLSSSCSFSALASTRAIFDKGAGLAPSLAFMLASTNLVIELGMVIAIFLGWQFVVGEYVGGILLILVTWLLIRITRPRRLEAQARRKMDDDSSDDDDGARNWKQTITSEAGWQQIGQTYVMEWLMVWKDVLIGFTVAGIPDTDRPIQAPANNLFTVGRKSDSADCSLVPAQGLAQRLASGNVPELESAVSCATNDSCAIR